MKIDTTRHSFGFGQVRWDGTPDTTYELASFIADWLNSSWQFNRWCVRYGTPGHVITYDSNPYFEIKTTNVVGIPQTIFTIDGPVMTLKDISIDAHDPNFFGQLKLVMAMAQPVKAWNL